MSCFTTILACLWIVNILVEQVLAEETCADNEGEIQNYSKVFEQLDVNEKLPGYTRSVVKKNYVLIGAESRVWEKPVGGDRYLVSYLITPAMGANFVMYLGRLDSRGRIGKKQSDSGQVIFILDGSLEFNYTDQLQSLTSVRIEAGGFIFFPPGIEVQRDVGSINGCGILVYDVKHNRKQQQQQQLIYDKNVNNLPVLDASPEVFTLRKLLPITSNYDFNVHVMDFQPGEYLVIKEVHRNQHGLLMLQGQGVYRLGNDWYPVSAGDVIWMGPFVPQWYGALGKIPTRYIIYKDTWFQE